MTEIRVTIGGMEPIVLRFDRAAVALRGNPRAVVGTNLGYAKAVHDGSPPHVIRPKGKKALYWRGAAHPVRSVRHPGYKGNPFITDGLQAQRGAIVALLQARIGQVVAGGGGNYTQAMRAAGLLVEGAAKARANVKTGTLRRSIHTEVYGR